MASLLSRLLQSLFKRGYDPRDFDITYPEITRVFIGECGGTGSHVYEVSGRYIAHAHCCTDDPIWGTVCFTRRDYAFNQDTVKHEVAHMRANHWDCYDQLMILAASSDMPSEFIIEMGHGPAWVFEMKKLGIPDPQIYVQRDSRGNII